MTCGVNRSLVTIVAVGQIACPDPLCHFGLPCSSSLDFERIAALGVELAFHVASQVKVAAMGNSFELPKLPLRQERKRILNVGRAGGVVAQLVGLVVAQLQPPLGEPIRVRDTT